MTDPGASGPDPHPPRTPSDLKVRALSAVVMMVAALGALWAGGWIFVAVAAAACALIMTEWTAMSGPFPGRFAAKGAIAFVAASVVASVGQPLVSAGAIAVVGITIMMFGIVERSMTWLGGGVLYAGLPGVAAVALRGSAETGTASTGLFAIAFVFVVVWATDSAAYFAGRRIGGPKLAPRISPKKTWSGAIGGALAALAVGTVAGVLLADGEPLALGLVALALAVVSQAGDLGESAMKRHFGVKDSGRLIPGHGGIMDRVDGLVTALVAAAVVGLVRNDADAAAGLLIW